MCLIFLKPKDAKNYLTYDRFCNALENNPDSIGIVYKGEKGLVVKKYVGKTLKDKCKVKKIYDKINSKDEFAIHFRYATHGKVDEKNCHPYYMGRGIWVMHNGIISGYGDTNKSDTKDFIDKFLKPYTEGEDGFMNDVDFIHEVGNLIGHGNKLLLIDNDFNWSIVNDKSGQWIDGCWLSNLYSIEPMYRTYKNNHNKTYNFDYNYNRYDYTNFNYNHSSLQKEYERLFKEDRKEEKNLPFDPYGDNWYDDMDYQKYDEEYEKLLLGYYGDYDMFENTLY